VQNLRFVVAGYVLTGVALGGYALALFRRIRRARARTEAVAARRREHPVQGTGTG
jgi:hypothetical protein